MKKMNPRKPSKKIGLRAGPRQRTRPGKVPATAREIISKGNIILLQSYGESIEEIVSKGDYLSKRRKIRPNTKNHLIRMAIELLKGLKEGKRLLSDRELAGKLNLTPGRVSEIRQLLFYALKLWHKEKYRSSRQ